jgi:hypothetical protein
MGDILLFPSSMSTALGSGVPKAHFLENWKVIGISQSVPGRFDVAVWDGTPGAESSRSMFLGFSPTLLAASELARRKALVLGVEHILDLSDRRDEPSDTPPPGDAA